MVVCTGLLFRDHTGGRDGEGAEAVQPKGSGDFLPHFHCAQLPAFLSRETPLPDSYAVGEISGTGTGYPRVKAELLWNLGNRIPPPG